jgi:inosose dehydratase
VLENINFQSESFLKSVLKGVFTVPGDGGIDFVSIGNVIKASGYEGWIIVEAEQDPAIYNPLELAISSKKYLDKIWSN